MAARRTLRAWLPCATLFAAAALSIAACGGSSPSASSSDSAASAGAPAGQVTAGAGGVGQVTAGAGGVSHASAGTRHDLAGHDVVSSGVRAQRPMRGTGGNEINDDNPGIADSGSAKATGQLDPCALVSKGEAQAIIGGRIAAPQEAPLGPTCIYQRIGAKSAITLTVETVDFAKIGPLIRHRVRMSVAGRTVVCGDYGRPTTFVPLPNRRVLTITAPCEVGTRLAAKALPRLHA